MSVIRFKSIYQTRIWGGQNLRERFGREIPSDEKIGEGWELVDRPEACSQVIGEPTQTLHDLWQQYRTEYFGTLAPETPRFPILIKLLDCKQTLSVQVHPPAAKAAALQGEPKTEMWYFLHTEKEALIYAGLKAGVTPEDFRQAIGRPELAGLLHTLPTQPGEAMFLPSGRVHAIGAGNLILEIQQNSDTTYRVDDWGRVDEKTGQPRELHVEQALASINFEDAEPAFVQPHGQKIIECIYFSVRRNYLYPGEFRTYQTEGKTFHYQFVAQGEVSQEGTTYRTGDAWLVTADHPSYNLDPGAEGAEVVTVEFPGI
jgi:mannose-6-phosphate isomerase